MRWTSRGGDEGMRRPSWGRQGVRDGQRPRRRSLAAFLELRDLVGVAQGEPDVVEALEKPPPSVVVDVEGNPEVAQPRLARLQVDRHRDSRLGVDGGPDTGEVVLADHSGQQALLARVAAEDVGELGAQDDAEAVVAQRPDGVLAAGAGADRKSTRLHSSP